MKEFEAAYSEEEKEVIKRAKMKALKLLEFSDKTERQLRDKLKEGDFPPFAVDEAIEYVKSFHYLDDKRFGEIYVRTKKESKSRFELIHALREKGLDSDTIDAVMEEAELNESDNIARMYVKKYGMKDQDDPQLFQKAVRYFAGKGYSYDQIREGIAAALDILSEKS